MAELERKLFKTIFMVTDIKGVLYYSSLKNKKVIKKLFKTFNIKSFIKVNYFIQIKIGEYILTTERFYIKNKLFCSVIIESTSSHPVYEDFFTGLYNRNYWERMKSGIMNIPDSMLCSIVLVDIDNLKGRNDLYGHIEGDRAIRAVGNAIKNSVRRNDIPIHYGGDEYIIILPNTDISGAKKIIKRIRNEIRKTNMNEKLKIEISAGAACSDSFKNLNLELLLKLADENMYIEKKSKKKQSSIFGN
nr:GGDEF domain-containing protein [Sedimentibacter sp.]